MPEEPTLCRADHDETLAQLGYLHLPGIARPLVGDLLDLLDHLPQPRPTGHAGIVPSEPWNRQRAPGDAWQLSTDSCRPPERQWLKDATASMWADLLDHLFTDHQVVITTFLTKQPGSGGVLPLHQDPSVVDERRHRATSVWIALDDIATNLGNGPIHVLEASHRVGYEWRGTDTQPSYLDDLDGLESLWADATPVDVAAGDVLLWDSRLLHGSPPNDSGLPRRALAGVCVARATPLCHAVAAEGDRVEILRVDEQFFVETSPRATRDTLPTGYPVIATVPRADEPTSTEALLARPRH